jgi:tetratricopeptide (TPR) repeat protein
MMCKQLPRGVSKPASTRPRACIRNLLPAVCALLVPLFAHGQCPPLVDSTKLKAAESAPKAPGPPEFFDEPQFTVAGVTDATNLGGHGSDTILRTKEAFAKETASLSRNSINNSQPPLSASVSVEKSLREAAEREPNNFEANRELGKFLVEHGKGREAVSYLERASGVNASDFDNNHELALAYVEVGRYDEAEEKIRELLAHPGPAKSQADLHHLLGDIEEKKGTPLGAVQQYQRAVELDPSERNIFDWASELLMHGAPEPAIEVLDSGNRRFPTSVRILTALGVAWYIRGSYEQAARRLCEASDLVPNDPVPYLFLGKLQTVEAPSEQVSARLERFARLQPANAMANYYYAVSLWKQRKDPLDRENLAQIEALLNKAVHLDPRLSQAYLQLGILYSEKKDFPRATAALRRTIEISPGMAEAHYRLAQAYKRAGEPSKAEQELQFYNRVSSENADAAVREHHELQRFLYTLRSPVAPVQSQ